MKLLRQGEGNSGRRRHRAPAATHCGARATSTGGMLARSTARARRKMLALPQLRPKKATPWSEAGDAMPIRGNTVLATLPSPARKGLLRCEIRTGLWSPDGGDVGDAPGVLPSSALWALPPACGEGTAWNRARASRNGGLLPSPVHGEGARRADGRGAAPSHRTPLIAPATAATMAGL
ncbi:hypothetical protein XMIN_1582 [Xanthomonas citri pv. mangiferaeindicae LMG 941]|nr:hypothetical protein XMIN_1582 [Xanthomonas citri pv. mangiferaeindicae LMG 941]